jgi:hypothetical protein
MEISQEHKAQIEEIISGMDCPKDFKCYKSGFENLCEMRIIHNTGLIECLDVTSWLCELSFRFGMGHYCNCPLRKYIAQNFDR